jgi:hypothetical protein
VTDRPPDESQGSLQPRPAASESQRHWVAQAAAGALKAADAASSGEMKGEYQLQLQNRDFRCGPYRIEREHARAVLSQISTSDSSHLTTNLVTRANDAAKQQSI